MTSNQSMGMSRRTAIKMSVAAGLGTVSVLHGFSGDAGAQAGAPPVPWDAELRELRPNVFAYVQTNGPGKHPNSARFGGGHGLANAGVIVGKDHLMVIDTMGQPLHVKAFKEAIRHTIGDKPFGRVVNTHHHNDQVNGNQFFAPIEIVGHPFCRQMVLQMRATRPPEFTWLKFEVAAEATKELEPTPPTTTFTDKLTYVDGDTMVELLHLGIAHTWGDIVAYMPEHRILFAGDIACFDVAPFAHQGSVTSWSTVIDKLLDMDVDTIIPSHGPIGTKKELAELREYFAILTKQVRPRFDAGMSPGRAAAEINLGRFGNWVGSERVLVSTCRLYEEFSGTLTSNPDIQFITRAAEEFNAIRAARSRRTGRS